MSIDGEIPASVLESELTSVYQTNPRSAPARLIAIMRRITRKGHFEFAISQGRFRRVKILQVLVPTIDHEFPIDGLTFPLRPAGPERIRFRIHVRLTHVLFDWLAVANEVHLFGICQGRQSEQDDGRQE